jgi:lysozyme
VVINKQGLKIVRDSEGLYLKSYRCPAGVWTIGWGSTGPDVKEGLIITEEKAEELLRIDLAWAEKVVTSKVKVPLNDNQFSALVSLVFNIGSGNFGKSLVLSELNAKRYLGASKAFLNHVYARGGIFMPGLEVRRKREIELFLTPVMEVTKPLGIMGYIRSLFGRLF